MCGCPFVASTVVYMIVLHMFACMFVPARIDVLLIQVNVPLYNCTVVSTKYSYLEVVLY
jgi:hypothetical protein